MFESLNKSTDRKARNRGAIKLGNSTDPSPDPGTIRWTGTDFEGWNGLYWTSLTGKQISTITDIDGHPYKTINIGTQEWMIENLRTSRFNDNQIIPKVTDPVAWNGLDFQPAYCWYDNDSTNHEIPDGKLYNFWAASSPNLCPVGWRTPNSSDWSALINTLGGDALAGGRLKEAGTSHWIFPNTAGSNLSGFTGLPGGRRGTLGTFVELGDIGYWWDNSGSGGAISASYQSLNSNSGSSIGGVDLKTRGLSVRCVKN